MIVELIGCAGAGKTTLAGMLCERQIAALPVRAMTDLVLGHPVLRRVTHPTAVNVVQELGSFPFFVGAWRSDREFVGFARNMLARHARSTFDSLNGMRGIVRKVGMYRLAASRAGDSIVISDEGTLLSAYNLFVMTDDELEPSEVDRFMELVPLPDRAVYVRAPAESLVERAHLRPTPRRQHRGRGRVEVESDVRRTVNLFDVMAASPLLRGRLLVVENGDGDDRARRLLADEIGRWLERPEVGVESRAPLARILEPEIGA